MISFIGLIILSIAWASQFLLMDKKKKIQSPFIILYVLGVSFLIYDGFSSGLNDLAIANLVTLIISLAVLIKLRG